MKKILMVCLLFFYLAVNLFSQFKAIHIPFDKLSTINIDGDINDWNWVPNEYIVNFNQFNDVLSNSEANINDWNCRLIVAWNEIQNWLYIVAYIEDDESFAGLPLNQKSCYYDSFQFSVNPNNYYYDVSNTRINGICYIPEDLSTGILEIKNGPYWLESKNRYLKWRYSFNKEGSNKKTVIIYELGMQLWNTFSQESAMFSEKHFLTHDESIKLIIGFDDIDTNKKSLWVTADKPTDRKCFKQTEQFAKFLLTL